MVVIKFRLKSFRLPFISYLWSGFEVISPLYFRIADSKLILLNESNKLKKKDILFLGL